MTNEHNHNAESKLHALARHVFHLANPDNEGYLTGIQLRPLMLISKLSVQALATIWNSVDTAQLGKVFLSIFCSVVVAYVIFRSTCRK